MNTSVKIYISVNLYKIENIFNIVPTLVVIENFSIFSRKL